MPPHLMALIHVWVGIVMIAPFADLTDLPGENAAWRYFAVMGAVYTGLAFALLHSCTARSKSCRPIRWARCPFFPDRRHGGRVARRNSSGTQEPRQGIPAAAAGQRSTPGKKAAPQALRINTEALAGSANDQRVDARRGPEVTVFGPSAARIWLSPRACFRPLTNGRQPPGGGAAGDRAGDCSNASYTAKSFSEKQQKTTSSSSPLSAT